MTWAFPFCNIKLFNLEKKTSTPFLTFGHYVTSGFLFEAQKGSQVMRPNLQPSHYEKSRGSFVQKARGSSFEMLNKFYKV